MLRHLRFIDIGVGSLDGRDREQGQREQLTSSGDVLGARRILL